MNNTISLASILNAAPKGTYHAKVHLAETTVLGGLKVTRVAHLTDIDNTALGAVCIEDAETREQEYSCSQELESLMASLVVERIDYLVSPYRL
jgi:hypothetical protein